MRKIFFILVVLSVALLSLVTVSAGLFGDDVTVKGVTAAQYPAGDGFDIIIVPNTDIDHINSIKLQNVELVCTNNTFNISSVDLRYDVNDADNIVLDQFNALKKDYQFEFTFIFKGLKDVNRDTDSYHIKGDIVINTTTKDNDVIGHIDTDAPINHKSSEQKYSAFFDK